MWEDFFAVFSGKTDIFCLDFKNGGVPPPHFRQIGGLPLYQNRHSVSIIICKDGREEYELQHKLLYFIERYIVAITAANEPEAE